MDAQTLSDVMGGALPLARYQELLPAYEHAMRAAGINNVNRAASWAAQLGHECVGLSALEEYASGAAYEGRSDLGNTQPGDGIRYKGRGAIMVTGRANYRNLSKWAHAEGLVPSPTYFEDHPKELQSTKYAFIGAIWYWTVARPNLNRYSDAGDVFSASCEINGWIKLANGTWRTPNGYQDRLNRWNRALPMGNRLLPSDGASPAKKPHEFQMNYSRDNVTQLTPWNCGPASTETAILAATGQHVHENQLVGELGTHQGGTDWIGQFPEVLNRHIPDGEYTVMELPNDPPTNAQKEDLWEAITTSLAAGHPVIANIVAPPSNYPKSVYPSTIDLAYSGGTVFHYVAILGVAGEGAGRRVWWADSGFAPFGAWISFDQTATLIPPKGIAYSTAPAKFNLDEEDLTVSQADRIIQELKQYIDIRLTGPVGSDLKDVRQQLTGGRDSGEYPGWQQLGQTPSGANLTLVDGVAATRADIAALSKKITDLMAAEAGTDAA